VSDKILPIAKDLMGNPFGGFRRFPVIFIDGYQFLLGAVVFKGVVKGNEMD